MRVIIGNVCFAAIIAAWYAAFGSDRAVMLAGTIFVFVTFVIGVSMGYALSAARGRPLPRVGGRASAGADTSVFDHIR
jgi:hypothetical protein